MNHDTIMALAEDYASLSCNTHEGTASWDEVSTAQEALSAALSELVAERDAWQQSNADQIELLNKIADERDALAKRNADLEAKVEQQRFILASGAAQKPAECVNGCPPMQICDYCQGTGGKDKQAAPAAREPIHSDAFLDQERAGEV